MSSARRYRILSASLSLAALAAACDAELEQSCVGGDGTCDVHELAVATVGAGGSTGGSGGSGGGGGADCLDACDTRTVSGHTGEFPCAVEAIMVNCRRCHTELMPPLVQGAPFFLDTYEQSQELYFGVAIWARMKGVVESDFMPLQPPKLIAEEKTALIDDWICACAPPREAGVTCP